MEYINERNDIIEVGRELLETGLVARTWGNISAREDEDNFLITPSGLDYVTMLNEDIAEVNITSDEWKGKYKPSGERGVHKAAYKAFSDVNFVVHTHQTYATAIGLAGFKKLDITDEEMEKLGGITTAAYGLPGTDKLTNAVAKGLESGAHVILMLHHGVLVCGVSRTEAMERVVLLEEICKRNIKTRKVKNKSIEDINHDGFENNLKKTYPCLKVISTKELIDVSNLGKKIVTQLDDISQMVGTEVKIIDIGVGAVEKALKKTNALLVKGVGAVVRAENEDDLEALAVLMQKMAIVKLHTLAYRKRATISRRESIYMHENYVSNYSKQKKS